MQENIYYKMQESHFYFVNTLNLDVENSQMNLNINLIFK